MYLDSLLALTMDFAKEVGQTKDEKFDPFRVAIVLEAHLSPKYIENLEVYINDGGNSLRKKGLGLLKGAGHVYLLQAMCICSVLQDSYKRVRL